MSLATDPRIVRACEAFARRWGGLDRDNAAQEGRLAVLELEADRFAPLPSQAVSAARQRLRMACRREIRDRARLRRYGEWRRSLGGDRPDTRDVTAYLAALTDRQRESVRLRLWEGLSEAAAAAMMGCSPNTASQHYRAALSRLRSLYGD